MRKPNFIFWRPRTTYILIGALVLGLVYLTGLYGATHFKPTVEVRMGSGVYQLWLADNDNARLQGLSGVSDLRNNNGLLVKFDDSAVQSVLMEDVSVPLDIVWLGEDKTVVYIIKNVNLGASKADKEAGIIDTYDSKYKARYALELPAGSVANAGIKSGDTAVFDENEKKASFTWSR